MTAMIPTTTGAARALGLVLPELDGRIDGCAVRVPTQNVSMIDLVCSVGSPSSAAEINDHFRAAATGPLAGILGVSDEPLVSIDYNGTRLTAGRPVELFDGSVIAKGRGYQYGSTIRAWDVAPDGRFLMNKRQDPASALAV